MFKVKLARFVGKLSGIVVDGEKVNSISLDAILKKRIQLLQPGYVQKVCKAHDIPFHPKDYNFEKGKAIMEKDLKALVSSLTS